MERKFKLGDKVIFHSYKNFEGTIVGLEGSQCLIYSKSFFHGGHNGFSCFDKIQYEHDYNCLWAFEGNLTLKKEQKSFYTNKATVYYSDDGKKYVSLCHDEPFDLEKGVAMCLLKSKGIDYAKFQEILKSFENKTKKYKITLTEFFESGIPLMIHCDTEEKANALLKAFDKLGKKWCTGTSYLEENYWSCYKNKTCYTNNGMYGNVTSGVTYRFEFEEVDLNN